MRRVFLRRRRLNKSTYYVPRPKPTIEDMVLKDMMAGILSGSRMDFLWQYVDFEQFKPWFNKP